MISRSRRRTVFGAVAIAAVVAGSCTEVVGPITLSPPTGVTVTLLTPTSARISWTASPETGFVLSYNVMRDGTKIGETSNTFYVDTDLVEGKTYRYRVSANGALGIVSELSAESPAATISVPDVTAPRVLSTSPPPGATAMLRNVTVAVAFSEPIDETTLNATTFVVKGPGGVSLTGTLAYTPATRVAEFRPNPLLPNASPISVTITTGIKDIAGNRMASDFVFSFSTRDELPPTVTFTSPANGGSGVPVTSPISVTFSKPIDPTTITASSIEVKTTSSGVPVAGSVGFDAASRTATFSPSAALASATGYTVTVTTAVKDFAGNAMAAAYSFNFTTADASAPSVVSVSPPNGATGVSVGAVVSVVFSESMDPQTINAATLQLRETGSGASVSGVAAWVAAGNTATFTPLTPLAHSTSYTVVVSTAVRDPAGNALGSGFSSQFSTAAQADLTPPSVVSTSPASGATGVPVGAVVFAGFSESIDQFSINAATFTLTLASTGALVPGAISYNASTGTAAFAPSSALAFGTAYTATLTTGVKDLAGNPLAAAFSWSFSTAAAPDVTAPTVVSTAPADGAVNVSVNTVIGVTFSEAMDPLTINASTVRVTNNSTSAAVSATVTYNSANNSATFTPNAPLSFNTGYSITVTTGAKDAAGNSLTTPFTSVFATVAAPDNTAPTVVTVSPANGATSIGVATPVTVTFSEPMNSATINSSTVTLRVTSSGSQVAGSVSYDPGTSTATFTPNAPLAFNTGYTINVTTGAADVAGNGLAGTFTSTFATGNAPDTTPPTVSTTSPANGATNVAINTLITVTFSEPIAAQTINGSSIALRNTATSAEIAGTVSYNSGTNTATFAPTSALANSTGYTIIVTTAVRDQAGNQMASPFNASFTTVAGADTTPPTVTATSPPNGTTEVTPGIAVTVTFSEAMSASTINGSTFRLVATTPDTAVTGTVSYDGPSRVATFTPASRLQFGNNYRATVTTGAKDAAGNGLASDFSFTFTITFVQNVTGYWSGTTADGSVHVHFTLDEPYPNPSQNFALRPNNCGGQQPNCRLYPLTTQGQVYVGTDPVDVTGASGSFPQPDLSMTITTANGKTFTYTATVINSSFRMTGTISGSGMPPLSLVMDKAGP